MGLDAARVGACATRAWLCLLALSLLCTVALGAEYSCSVSGTILDATDRPVPRGRVMLVGKTTGAQREVVADANGKFEARRLPQDAYSVQAPPGGKTSAETSCEVVIDDREYYDPPYLPGIPAIRESNELRESPLNGRNYLDLIRNATEATRGQEGGEVEGFGPYFPGRNSGLNSLGQRGQSNSFRLNGMDNNEMWLRGAIFDPSMEAIEEVSVLAVHVPADLGHAAGAVIGVQSRAGTSRFHGSVFDYQQSAALNARNFFDGAHKPGLAQSQFGGNVGGPVRKAGGFFFANLELARERRGLTVISTVPSAAQKAGNFGSVPIYDPLTIAEVRPVVFERLPFAGNQVPLARISDQARSLLALYPDPVLPGAFNNYRFTPDLVRSSERLDVNYGKSLSSRNRVSANLNYQRLGAESPGALPGPDGSYAGSDPVQHANAAHTRQTAWSGVISHTFVASPALVNELRVGAVRMRLDAHALDEGLDAAAALGISGLGKDGLPVVRPTGYAQLGAAGPVPLEVGTETYQVEDTVHWIRGRHNWEFGAQAIRRHVDGTASEWTSRGTFLFTPDYTSQPGVDGTGNAIASLASGVPSEFRRDVQFEPFRLRGWEWAGFAQDSIRLGRRLTIEAGLRYSLYPPVTEADNRMVNFNHSRVTPALDQFAGVGSVNQYGGPGYKKYAVAPRIGFAVDLFGNGKTVVRGGFSQTYDTGAYISEGSLARNPPYAARQDIFGGSLQLGMQLADGVPAPAATALTDPASLNRARGAIYAIETAPYTPYSDQWGLSVQQQLRSGLTLELGGLGSMGMHLYAGANVNQPYPAPSPYQWRRYPYEPYVSRVEYVGYGGGSTYYGGQLKLAGQASSGLRLLACFRLAKSIDDATAPSSGQQSRPPAPQYIYDPRSTRSPSPYDILQRLVLTAFYDLPSPANAGSRLLRVALSNWRASSVVTLQSGFPFTPELAVNGLNNGGFQLPDRMGDGSLPSEQRSYLRWFNTSLDRTDPKHAFETPPLYQYGNSGFNTVRGPGLATVDGALDRSFALGGRLHLRARIEGFNLLNRTNFALPNRILGLESSGAINHTSTPSRQFQLAAKLEW
jgi:hypothetical protein